MSWRRKEFEESGAAVVWLSEAEAVAAYRQALRCSSNSRYGLNDTAFAQIDRLNAKEPGPAVRKWLAKRVGSADRLLLVFAAEDVCELQASMFLDGWQDMLCPSRDDVVILPVQGDWVLFYCHEDELEFARGGFAEQAPTAVLSHE